MRLNRVNYFWAAGFALCLPMFGFGLDSAVAKANGSSSNSGSSSISSSSTSFSYSSKVSGGTVTIYGNSTTNSQSSKPANTQTSTSKSPARAPAKTAPKLPAKPAAPVKASPKPALAAKPPAAKITPAKSAPSKVVATTRFPAKSAITNLLKASPKQVVPLKLRPPLLKPNPPKVTVPIKAAPKKTVVTIKLPASSTSTSASATGEATFAPNDVSANAYPPAVNVGDPVFLAASATQHYRSGQILNRVTEVRFTPIATRWAFVDGSIVEGSTLTHTFASPGTHVANVTVRYLVSYRFAGQSAWVVEPGSIEMIDQVTVLVSASSQVGPPGPATNLEPDTVQPYLVGSNCNQRPNAFGCTTRQ